MADVFFSDIVAYLLSGDEAETWSEELFNGLTHFLALMLAVFGCYLLTLIAIYERRSWHHVLGCISFGCGLLILYTCSTLYHTIGVFDHANMVVRNQFQQLDHLAIYFMIAGTYTPVMLVGVLHDKRFKDVTAKRYGAVLLCLQWLCVFLGVGVKLVLGVDGVNRALSNGFYLFMGWLGILGIRPIMKCVPAATTPWLLSGGLSYSFGVLFLTWDSLHYNHAIWHLFVMSGGIAHFFAVLSILLGPELPKSMGPFQVPALCWQFLKREVFHAGLRRTAAPPPSLTQNALQQLQLENMQQDLLKSM
jgi:hemolysin III